MPSQSHLKTLEAIRRSSLHQSVATPSSSIAMMRFRAAAVADPAKALDLVRCLIQKEITEKIAAVLSEYADEFFQPAVENAKRNCGGDVAAALDGEALIADVCVNALEAAKAKYKKVTTASAPVAFQLNPSLTIEPTVLSRKRKTESYTTAPPEEKVANLGSLHQQQPSVMAPQLQPPPPPPPPPPHPPLIQRSNSSDLILITKQGKPVRREGPGWEPSRISTETTFILGSKANKALGLGQTRGRLYMKHPELFKYSGDAEDKEWLTKSQVMSTTGGKAYLMVMQDIIALSKTDEYASSSKLQPDELAVGFNVPQFMVQKMKAFMTSVRTDSSVSDEALLARAKDQLIMNMEKKTVSSKPAAAPAINRSGDGGAIFVPSVATGDGQVYVVPPTEASCGSAKYLIQAGGTHEVETTAVAPTNLEGLEDCEIVTANVSLSEAEGEDLGSFLHGMNLNSLVKEFESTEGDVTSGGILSLADDDVSNDGRDETGDKSH